MDILISNSSNKPIYEQISAQIKDKILAQELKPGEALPSMRLLAKELRISVITTKRAYEELERDGFIETVQGKGCFVSGKNNELVLEERLRAVEENLLKAIEAARPTDIQLEQMIDMLKILYNEVYGNE